MAEPNESNKFFQSANQDDFEKYTTQLINLVENININPDIAEKVKAQIENNKKFTSLLAVIESLRKNEASIQNKNLSVSLEELIQEMKANPAVIKAIEKEETDEIASLLVNFPK